MDNGMRVHLSYPGILKELREAFSKFSDPLEGHGKKFSLEDCLMSAMAIFGMKCSSLLQFDKLKAEKPVRHNLKTLYGVKKAPCDTQMRARLDEVDPEQMKRAYKAALRPIQRSGVLTEFRSIEGYYPFAQDGTGVFSSHKVHCENCCVKEHRDGSKTYHHQILSAVLVNPDKKEVLPLMCEPIIKQDGVTKNDCEINASKRLLPTLKAMHPNLKMLFLGDAIYANGPHIKELTSLGYGYLIGVTPDGHKSLFDWVSTGSTTKKIRKGKVTYHFSWFNGAPINDTHHDQKVNFIACREVHDVNPNARKNLSEKVLNWSWVTNIKITEENVLELFNLGKTRWHIENETFNTLKNQGYEFEHNFGHGEKNLSTVFSHLMMLAFLVDQIQELCCPLFQKVFERYRKCDIWDYFRAYFMTSLIASWEALLIHIANPYRPALEINST